MYRADGGDGPQEMEKNKQQPGTAGPGNMLGSCLISFHFLWGKLSTRTVGEAHFLKTVKTQLFYVFPRCRQIMSLQQHYAILSQHRVMYLENIPSFWGIDPRLIVSDT